MPDVSQPDRAAYEYRSAVSDGSTPDYTEASSLEEAQERLRDDMAGAEPPFDSGWIEFREVGPWQHISAYPQEVTDA